MKVFEDVEELKQHIEANLQGLAKAALEKSRESGLRADQEQDGWRKGIWQREAEAEKRIAKMINDECERLLHLLRQE